MTKAELVSKIAEKGGYTKKDAEKALSTVVGSITDVLTAGDKVTLIGFGTFEARKRKAKTARNPRTGETVKVPATKVAAFKPGAALKAKVAKK